MKKRTNQGVLAGLLFLGLAIVIGAGALSGRETPLPEHAEGAATIDVLAQPGSPQADSWVAFFQCSGGLNQDDAIVRTTLFLNDTDTQAMWNAPLTAPATISLALRAGPEEDLTERAAAVLRQVRTAPSECEAVEP